jgi:rhodanese-related sulfurtransferase
MKKSSKLILILMMSLTGSAAFAADAAPAAPAAQAYTAKSPKLNRVQIDALLAKPEQLLVIDVRQPDEITNIGGFPAYLSIQNGELENSLAFIPKDRTIIVLSNHAGRAGKAADLLVSKGFNVAGAVGVQNY